MECTKDLVGITKTDCPCVVDDLPPEVVEDMATSKSNLFLDTSLDGCPSIQDIRGAFPCQQYAEMALEARTETEMQVDEDIILAVGTKLNKKKETFVGTLGDMGFNLPYTPEKSYVGLGIQPVSRTPDAVVRLTGLALATLTSISTTVKLYRSYEGESVGELVGSWPVTTAPQQISSVPNFSPLELRMYDKGMPVFHYLQYDRMNAQPMNNRTKCDCGGVEKIRNEFISLKGIESDDDGIMTGRMTNYTGGLIVQAAISCKPDNFICRNYNDKDETSRLISRAFLYLLGAKMIDKILTSNNLNYYTMVSRETLYGKKAHFLKEYEYRMKILLPRYLDLNASDCYVCKESPHNQPTVGLIKM